MLFRSSPYLFSGPNWPYGAFGGKSVPECSFVHPKNDVFGCNFLKQNWETFSSGTILPPNAPYSQLGPEKRYGATFIKKFQPKTSFLGWTKLHSGTLLPPNAPCSELGPEKRYGAGFIKKFHTKTCFLGWTKLHSGILLPPIMPCSPFGQENR